MNSRPKDGFQQLTTASEGPTRALISSWPAIANNSLQNSQVCQILANQLKLRMSETTLEDSIIFPMSGVTFLLLSANKTISPLQRNTGSPEHEVQEPSSMDVVVTRVNKMLAGHKTCYLIFLSSKHCNLDWDFFDQLQKRFMFTRLKLIPVQSSEEADKCMLNIAMFTYKPISEAVWESLKRLTS